MLCVILPFCNYLMRSISRLSTPGSSKYYNLSYFPIYYIFSYIDYACPIVAARQYLTVNAAARKDLLSCCCVLVIEYGSASAAACER